ncbi:MAG: hypothetical protein FJW30_21355 [Acidobacteria bacterium]|nr:hypothetical protein [Acidobacteriota bacterium]
MPQSFPFTRFLLIGLAAMMLVSAVPAADAWVRAWSATHRLDRQIQWIDEMPMPVRVRPLSPQNEMFDSGRRTVANPRIQLGHVL